MKFPRVGLLLSVCFLFGTVSPAQIAKPDEKDYSKFLIDANKPYLYLEVDHLGPRKPLRNGEPNTGIWLRLKNNCKLAIVVLAVSSEPQNPGKELVLQDEIVPNRQVAGEDARGGGIFAPRGLERTLENMTDIVRFPNMTEEEVRSAEAAITSKVPPQRPLGYNVYNGFDRFEMTLVPSGSQVLFSVPANHVSKDWHFEIPFRLAVPNDSPVRPPYSYLAFYQEDLKNAQAPTPTRP